MARPRARTPKPEPVSWDTVRQFALTLPGVEESTSYGTPAFKVRGKLFVRKHQDGESLVIKVEPTERAMRIKSDPETFHITDHYLNTPWVLVRIASVAREDLRDLLTESWRQSAPKRLLTEYDEA